MKNRKILIIGAMEKELRFLVKELNCSKPTKILKRFPLYKTKTGSLNIGIVNTFVGETNAAIASVCAITHIILIIYLSWVV